MGKKKQISKKKFDESDTEDDDSIESEQEEEEDQDLEEEEDEDLEEEEEDEEEDEDLEEEEEEEEEDEEEDQEEKESTKSKKEKNYDKYNDIETIKKEVFSKKLRVVHEHKLSYEQTVKFCTNITSSPFHPTKCCIWKGSKSNKKKKDGKGTQGVIWINKAKRPIHRVVHNNFIGPLYKGEILKTTCKKRLCININHFLVKNKK